MDIEEARRQLAAHPRKGDPTAQAGETLEEKAARLGAVKPAVTTTTEYGYCYENQDGSRFWFSPLGTDRERALGQFRTLEGDDITRLVFMSRTVTDWTEAEEA